MGPGDPEVVLHLVKKEMDPPKGKILPLNGEAGPPKKAGGLEKLPLAGRESGQGGGCKVGGQFDVLVPASRKKEGGSAVMDGVGREEDVTRPDLEPLIPCEGSNTK